MAETLNGVTFYYNTGGRGTRLASVAPSVPGRGVVKANLEVGNGRIKLISHHANRARRAGAQQIIFGFGDHADLVTGQPGSPLPHQEATTGRYGTGGDMLQEFRKHRRDIGDNDMLVQNIDTVSDVDFRSVIASHRLTGALATIALSTRAGVPNENAYLVKRDGSVLYSCEFQDDPAELAAAEAEKDWQGSSTGVVALRADFLDDLSWRPSDGEYPLYGRGGILSEALALSGLRAYNNGEKFFMDVGTPDAYALARQHDGPLEQYLDYGH